MRMKALIDFNTYLQSLDDCDVSDELEVSFAGPMSMTGIQRVEAVIGCPLPQTLRDFLTQTGPFISTHFGDVWNTIKVFDSETMLEAPCGIIDHIDWQWGGRPELDDALAIEQMATLNARYKVFGTRCIDDNRRDYLFFSVDGGFYSLLLDQDDMDTCIAWLLGSISASPVGESLTELIEQQLSALKHDIEEAL